MLSDIGFLAALVLGLVGLVLAFRRAERERDELCDHGSTRRHCLACQLDEAI